MATPREFAAEKVERRKRKVGQLAVFTVRHAHCRPTSAEGMKVDLWGGIRANPTWIGIMIHKGDARGHVGLIIGEHGGLALCLIDRGEPLIFQRNRIKLARLYFG